MSNTEKDEFASNLADFALSLANLISVNNQWTIKGFIDVFKNVYTISTDTKVVSKILELHLFPHFLSFAKSIGYRVELATYQNWYPDLTFINEQDENIKFAVDLKTTYIDEEHPGFCNGFTLGSHGEYFNNRNSSKNIQYPYNQYSGHFCLGIIYSRAALSGDYESKTYSLENLDLVPSVIKDFLFFATEKWRIASDKQGSGNTANIGSIEHIEDILAGNGVFAKAGEEYFDDYWANYKRIQITVGNKIKPMTSFSEYLEYRGLPKELLTPKPAKRKKKLND
jgi:hypothetical protein